MFILITATKHDESQNNESGLTKQKKKKAFFNKILHSLLE